MFRGYSDSDKKEKEEPRIIFLQQLGRCIHAINPNNPDYDAPIVFDFACNFMRHNEKLNDMFEISPAQAEFRELYEDYFETANELTVPPKENNLARIMTVMKVLHKHNIDISDIPLETTFADLPIPEDVREEVLNDIFEETHGVRLKPTYNIGVKIQSARNAFWHRERKNEVSGGVKKLYNSETDGFFEKLNLSFEELYEMGFLKDIEPDHLDQYGFITDCAGIDKYYGYNAYTGTRYGFVTREGHQGEIWYADINGFTESGFNIDTKTRYDTRFFRYDKKTQSWVNFFTREDRDLLGFSHDGIMVERGRARNVGFDREGYYHKQLPDGTYSRKTDECNENGENAFGFSRTITKIGEFIKINGFCNYRHQTINGKYDHDSRDIEGYNVNDNFDINRVNKYTSCRFDKSGYGVGQDGKRTHFPLERLLLTPDKLEPKVQKALLQQWFALYYANENAVNNSRWFKPISASIVSKSGGRSIDEMLRERAKHFNIPYPLEELAREQTEMAKILDEKILAAYTRGEELKRRYKERQEEIEKYIKENGGGSSNGR